MSLPKTPEELHEELLKELSYEERYSSAWERSIRATMNNAYENMTRQIEEELYGEDDEE